MAYEPERAKASGRPAEPGAVVIGGDYRGLGVARSLGRRGIPVWVLRDEHVVATLSRYVHRSMEWPQGCEDKQLDLLCRLAGEFGLAGWTLFPTGDETAAFIARNHNVLSRRFRLTTPDWDVLRYAHDKRLTYQRAAELGIDHPRTFELDSAVAFPVILKPAWKDGVNAFTQAKAWEAKDRKSLEVAYREAAALVPAETILIQELIPGGGKTQFSYAALVDNGRPVVEVSARRSRQYPLDFGYFSTFVESIRCREIEEASRRFIDSLQFTGLIELEYKFDAREGTYKLLDVNPRVWGWHTLGRRAGGDFPYLAWMLSRGETVERRCVPAGRRWIYTSADALTVATLLRRGDVSMGEVVRTLRPGMEDAVFALDDPLPGIPDVPLAVQRQRRKVAPEIGGAGVLARRARASGLILCSRLVRNLHPRRIWRGRYGRIGSSPPA